MRVEVVDHPLVAERLTQLRDVATGHAAFRHALHDLTTFLVYEALRDLRVASVQVPTPLAPAAGVRVTEPPILVPVLRAGLGMLAAAQALLPHARIGFVGVRRDEATHLPEAYLSTVPTDLGGRPALVLDPMLATGGSLAHTCRLLVDANAGPVTVVCVLAAPEGVEALARAHGDLTLFTASIDERLNEHAFIVPGLGDAGDRQFGLA